jgi:hypothetical protein
MMLHYPWEAFGLGWRRCAVCIYLSVCSLFGRGAAR